MSNYKIHGAQKSTFVGYGGPLLVVHMTIPNKINTSGPMQYNAKVNNCGSSNAPTANAHACSSTVMPIILSNDTVQMTCTAYPVTVETSMK